MHPPISDQITFLYTDDLAATADFYENIMGFDLWLDQGKCRIYRVSKNGFVGFCQQADVQNEHRDIIFTIVTPSLEDVNRWYEYLKEKRIPFEKVPAENPAYKIYHCFLRDPNGYLIEIQYFLDQS
jgi:catechol 2,3-dioxygenase-like lactoylglutathione lyase family enzyme